jgi:hypothetical protein
MTTCMGTFSVLEFLQNVTEVRLTPMHDSILLCRVTWFIRSVGMGGEPISFAQIPVLM